jgi:hypothetical protein
MDLHTVRTVDTEHVVDYDPKLDPTVSFAEEKEGRESPMLKMAADGMTILIPQPSNDPYDPWNWSWSKKHTVLLSLAPGSLLCDGGMSWGTTLFEAQAAEWHMMVPKVANSVSGGVFMQGIGGLVAVPLTQRFGRYVELLVF